jgi:1-deoxy-D-xylulose-5-phosphate reductoisomerase
MNKGLELIEATHLFGLHPEHIDVLIHPQSIVHSLVEFCDGTWLAQLSVNDMVFPIQYALAYPERWGNEFPRLDLADVGRLEFEPLEEARFPAVALARRALAMGESGPPVLNAANEEAVHAFLRGEIPFPAVVACASAVLDGHLAVDVGSLEEALEWDAWARRQAREVLARRP